MVEDGVTMVATKSANDFRLLDPATLAEPYAYWQVLRETAPIHTVAEGIGFTIVTRYEDVITALRDPDTFSNQLSRRFAGGMSAYVDSDAVKEVLADGCPYSDALAFSDGELHARHRRMVRRGFTTARVRELDEVITATVSELIDALPMGVEVDMWKQFCIPLPVRIIGHILGVDASHADDVKRWADAQVARFGEPRETEEENLRIARDLVEFHQYLYRQLRSRREQPRDDFLSDLVHAAEETTENELVIVCAQILVAGAESSSSLLAGMLDLLLEHPERVAQLRADPSGAAAVVEETLRAESPIKLVYRITTRDVDLGGTQIPEGTVVLLMIGSASRDPRAFPEPEQFMPGREDARKHLAFGLGTHLCSGAELARAEGRIALQELLRRTSSITRGSHRPQHPPNLTVRAVRSLPVVLQPAAAADSSAG
jgi:cytochrome P450